MAPIRRASSSSPAIPAENPAPKPTWLWAVLGVVLVGMGIPIWWYSPKQPVNSAITAQETGSTVMPVADLPTIDMVYVPGGSFQMGSNEGGEVEKPVHTVAVDGFWMGKYEVTQRHWQSVMGNNPSRFKNCSDCPVETVSWDDVQVFLQKLNAMTGKTHRLPTEAEWEYAAGGGSGTRTRFGNRKDIADPQEMNFNGSEAYKILYSVAGVNRKKTILVGSFAPNGLGLYDMSGNVWEWCSDWYSNYTSNNQINPIGYTAGIYRVMRGGSWENASSNCRAANRGSYPPRSQFNFIGFRVVSQSP